MYRCRRPSEQNIGQSASMGPVRWLILLGVVGAVASASSICDPDECTCQERDGLQHVTCDCGGASDAQELLVGDPSRGRVSERTGSLRVRRCGRVSLVAEALSGAGRLTDLELSDISRLELQSDSLYRTDGGPPRRITVQRVPDLRVDPHAFRRVERLQQLEFTEVVTGPLPLRSFANGSDVLSFRLADSKTEDFQLKLDKTDKVTVTNCTMDSLDVNVGDILSLTMSNNTLVTLRGLQLNRQLSPHTTDAEVTIARNNIAFLQSTRMKMTLDRLEVIDNIISQWMAPMQVEFHTAVVTRNNLGRLSDLALRRFVRLDAVNLRRLQPTDGPTENVFTFSNNTVHASSHGQYDSILTPSDTESRETALFVIDGNQFECSCFDLKKLVRDGEKQLKSAQADDDGIFQWDQVYGQLYRSSSCVEDGRSLQQYRQDAYTEELECRSGAAAVTMARLTILLAVAARIAL